MTFEDFQDGHIGDHVRYRNDVSNSESLHNSDASHQVWLNQHYDLGRMSFEELQDGQSGSHLKCRNGMSLAVLNLHVSPVLLIKFSLIRLNRFKIFKPATMAAILDI